MGADGIAGDGLYLIDVRFGRVQVDAGFPHVVKQQITVEPFSGPNIGNMASSATHRSKQFFAMKYSFPMREVVGKLAFGSGQRCDKSRHLLNLLVADIGSRIAVIGIRRISRLRNTIRF